MSGYVMPTYRGLPVPFVARREGEDPGVEPWTGVQIERRFNVLTGDYENRLLCDRWHRDELGWLWQPSPVNLRGTPEFAQVHPARHRQCMDELLCQVCGDTAGYGPNFSSWLVMEVLVRLTQARDSSRPLEVNAPPVCPGCVELAQHHCPHLRGVGYVHVLARRVEPAGVIGDVYGYDEATGSSDILRQGIIQSHDPDAGMTLARQRVVNLYDWKLA